MGRGSPLFDLFNIISDGMYYFFPFLLSVSAAKKFKTNEYMALSVASALMHPTFFKEIASGIKSLPVLGILSIPYIDYSSSVIPIILSVLLLSVVYKFFQKHIPDILSVIFTPMLSLLIVIPMSLIALAPLRYYIGEWLAHGVQVIIDFSPMVAGFVLGALRPFTVLTGTHHAIRAITAQQIATYGYTTIGAVNHMSTMAQAAAALGVYLIVRDKRMKNLSFSAAVSSFLGVTEPALYSVIVKYKYVLFATAIGSGIGGAISIFFGAAEYAMVMPSILTIPATFGDGFIGIAIGLPASIIITITLIWLRRDGINKTTEDLNAEIPATAENKEMDVFPIKDEGTVSLEESLIKVLAQGGLV